MALNLWWLAVGRIIGGATSASFTAIYAYMADITTPEAPLARLSGIVGAAFGAGFIAGPALGGVLGEWGPRVPFWVAAALSGIAFVYGWLGGPARIPVAARAPHGLRLVAGQSARRAAAAALACRALRASPW